MDYCPLAARSYQIPWWKHGINSDFTQKQLVYKADHV